METNPLRDFILWLWDISEKRENELLAYEVTFALLRSSDPQIDKLLDEARKNPSPELAKRHREARETIERLLDGQNPGDDLMKFLREWKSPQ